MADDLLLPPPAWLRRFVIGLARSDMVGPGDRGLALARMLKSCASFD
jgi:hypothetical protein